MQKLLLKSIGSQTENDAEANESCNDDESSISFVVPDDDDLCT